MKNQSLNKVLKLGSIILIFSGFMDMLVYFLFNYRAPSWVLGITLISIAAILLAVSKTLQV